MNLVRSYEKRITKFRSWLFDQKTYKLTRDELLRMTQLDKTLDFQADRLQEFARFYNISVEEAAQVQSIRDKDALEDMFNNVETDAGLIQNYQDASFLYTGRLQLAYSRFPVAYDLLKYFNSHYFPWQRANIKVLDYGCGVGDYGLAFAVNGYRTTLCDIAGGNLDFSIWRFRQRKLIFETIPVSLDHLYPALPEHHLVLAGEVLEHVREPLTVLKNIHACLPKDGYIWYSGYPDIQREVGGDHLVEAAEQRQEAFEFVQANFRKASLLQLPGFLYKKI